MMKMPRPLYLTLLPPATSSERPTSAPRIIPSRANTPAISVATPPTVDEEASSTTTTTERPNLLSRLASRRKNIAPSSRLRGLRTRLQQRKEEREEAEEQQQQKEYVGFRCKANIAAA